MPNVLNVLLFAVGLFGLVYGVENAFQVGPSSNVVLGFSVFGAFFSSLGLDGMISSAAKIALGRKDQM